MSSNYKLLLFIEPPTAEEIYEDSAGIVPCDEEGYGKQCYKDYEKLCEIYEEQIIKHNEKQRSIYPDAGFDLYIPEHYRISPSCKSIKISHGIKCAMYKMENNSYIPVSYYMYPRSSFSKTPLILANHVGIFDAGYRGSVLMAVRNLANKDNCDAFYNLQQYDRLMQICAPDLGPIHVQRVYCLEDLNFHGFPSRAEKGFGSTGR